MARGTQRKADLQQFIIDNVRANPQNIAALTIARFGVSREWVARVLNELCEAGLLRKEGRTKGVRYTLVDRTSEAWFPVTSTSEEHLLWNEHIVPHLDGLPATVLEICHYGFTEMVNNVIDHSESERCHIVLTRAADRIRLQVLDFGVGIFMKIKRVMGLESPRNAVLELSKGKFTTDPAHHSGEGVFFCSRVFDHFSILSSSLFFAHDRDSDDWLLANRHHPQSPMGTSICMDIQPGSNHTLNEVIDHYTVEREDFAFNRTRLVLRLAQETEGPLISRSQAKRVLGGLYKFKEVLFDFTGVESIGPAFADEVFRVYRAAHPDIEIIPLNMGEQPSKMVLRALRAGGENSTPD